MAIVSTLSNPICRIKFRQISLLAELSFNNRRRLEHGAVQSPLSVADDDVPCDMTMRNERKTQSFDQFEMRIFHDIVDVRLKILTLKFG